tara:strand:+ start:746 stop:862 length:117 start_codon:yes stop_codon:yes gene_type:complete
MNILPQYIKTPANKKSRGEPEKLIIKPMIVFAKMKIKI